MSPSLCAASVCAGLLLGTAVSAAEPAKPPVLQKPPSYPEADATARGADILGIRLGMPLDQVQAVLKSRGDFKETRQPITFRGASMTLTPLPNRADTKLHATAPQSKDTIDVQFTPGPGVQRALFVQRTVEFAPESMLFETVKKSIFDKYQQLGTPLSVPSQAPTATTQLVWTIGEKTAPMPPNIPPVTICGSGVAPLMVPHDQSDIKIIEQERQTMAQCGPSVLNVYLKRWGNTPYATFFTVTLMSRAMYQSTKYDLLMQWEQLNAQQEQQKMQKAGTAPKPQL
jgi:hypothetical protein